MISERSTSVRTTWPMTAAAWSALIEEIERLGLDVDDRAQEGLARIPPADPTRRRRVLLSLREGAVVVQEADEAAIGRRVTIRDDDGSVATYALVLPGDGEPSQGWLAADAPLGSALLGARPGDRVLVRAPAGERWVEVIAVGDG